MMILPGPQGLTSKLCAVDLFKGTLFQFGFLGPDEESEGPARLTSTGVLEVDIDDIFEGLAPLSSSSMSTSSRAAFNV